MAISTRTEFIDYCLRQLGAPVVEINVAPEQVEDNVTDAVDFFMKYHYLGTIRTYLKHQITASDIANNHIYVPDYILDVVRVIPFSMTAMSGTLAEVQYQAILSDLLAITQSDMIGYDMTMRHLTLLNHLLNPIPVTEFNKYRGYLTFSNGIDGRVKEGDWLILECHRLIDPSEFSKAWNDLWLKRYATALIKKQWASNIKKFAGMQLPGGVTLDGPGMYQEAMAEIKELEDELINEKFAPSAFFVG